MLNVWIHGTLSGGYFWQRVLQALPKGNAVHVCVDRVGYGKAPQTSAQYNLNEELDWLDQSLDEKFDRTEPCALIAHSYGAYFALQWALRMPGRVKSVALIDPLLVNVMRLPGGEKGFEEMEEQYWSLTRMRQNVEEATAYFFDHWNAPMKWSLLREESKQELIARFPRVLQEMELGRSDRTSREAYLHVADDWCLIVGSQTRPAAIATAELLSDVIGSEIHRIEGAGHMPPISHPAATAQILHEFHSK